VSGASINQPLYNWEYTINVLNKSLRDFNSMPLTKRIHQLDRSVDSLNKVAADYVKDMIFFYTLQRRRTPWGSTMPDFMEKKPIPEGCGLKNHIN